MSDDKFKLPISSYDELVKFIKAYSTVTKPADISEISSLTSSASSPAGATSAHSLASFLRQSLLSYLAAALLFVNPAPSVFVGDAARAAGNTAESTQGSAGSDSGKKQNAPGAYQRYLEWAAERKSRIRPIDVDSFLPAARETARSVPSLFLSPQQKVETVETFVKVVGIKSWSRAEAVVREELRNRLLSLDFVEVPCGVTTDPNAPLNLVMELPASQEMRDRPAVILNAHMDTIQTDIQCTPEEMTFDAGRREFYHNRNMSFGADDKAGIVTILSALEAAKTAFWDKGIGHRRIVVIFTAQEEAKPGAVGARYLASKHPELFEGVEMTLVMDGPLDFDVESARKAKNPIDPAEAVYPKHSFVIVVDEERSRVPPFSGVMASVKDICRFKNVSYFKTELGLGGGDCAGFPVQAKADLTIRVPHLGWHTHEKVKLDDFFNHVDLFTYILLRLDGVSLRLNEEEGRLYLSQPDDKHPSDTGKDA